MNKIDVEFDQRNLLYRRKSIGIKKKLFGLFRKMHNYSLLVHR